MSLLSMLTILMLTIDLGKKAQLLTVQDVKEILEEILPKREITEMGVLNLIEKKHKARYFFKLQEWVYEAAIRLIRRGSHIIVKWIVSGIDTAHLVHCLAAAFYFSLNRSE